MFCDPVKSIVRIIRIDSICIVFYTDTVPEKRATANYAMRDGGWVVTSGRSAAFGRTLEKARENIATALAEAMSTYSGNIAIDDRIEMDAAAARAVAHAHASRDAALKAEAESRAATRTAANELQQGGLSLRDIAYVLGLSHARVHQIVQGEN
jgi:hypothetical protein